MKTDFVAILRERNFPLSFRDFGRIVGLTPHHLRELYRSDQDRFFTLLDDASEKWLSICKSKH
jgi:hypothetical protein